MTSEECGYREGTSYDYEAAGKRCNNMTADQAVINFDNLAVQYGVNSGDYGSWDLFWIGYRGG